MPDGELMFADTPSSTFASAIRPAAPRVLSPAPLPGKRYARAPLVVEWELTRACALVCRHCRVQPITERHAAELTTAEAQRLLEQVKAFSNPPPQVLITGGDPLERADLPEIVSYGAGLGVHITVHLCPTDRLSAAAVQELARAGARCVSLGLDAADAAVHDGERGETGSFARTLDAARWVREAGLDLRILTRVTETTMIGLEALARLVVELGAAEWALEFPLPVPGTSPGRTVNAWQYGVVMRWLDKLAPDAPFSITTINGPQWQRLIFERLRDQGVPLAEIRRMQAANRLGLRDGRGMLFVTRSGDVYPSRWLRLPAGNVRSRPLLHIYRRAPVFAVLKDEGRLRGKCGLCPYRAICGGSRARAYAATGDLLGPDPWCLFSPWRGA